MLILVRIEQKTRTEEKYIDFNRNWPSTQALTHLSTKFIKMQIGQITRYALNAHFVNCL